jgi:photosystem II stability/assembly factor-like uncharacterized protein
VGVVGLAALGSAAVLAAAGASAMPSCAPTCASSIVVAAQGDRTVLYAAHRNGVSTSTNGGSTWRQGRGFHGDRGALQVVASAAEPSVAYAGGWVLDGHGQTGKVFASADGGRSWRVTGFAPEGGYWTVLVLDPSDSRTVYAGTNEGLYRSTSGGKKWQRLALRPGRVTDVAVEPGRPSNLYADVAGRGVYRSTDGGRSWRGAMDPRRYGGFIAGIEFDPLTPGALYAGTNAGIFASRNGGAWRRVDRGTMWDNRRVHSLAFDAKQRGTMYAVTYCEGIFRSSDGGRSWQDANDGFDPGCRPPFAIAVDPRNSRVLYALTPDVGLFKSSDGGRHWRRTPQP